MAERNRELLDACRFVPFRVTMAGGTEADVVDPKSAELTPSVLRLYSESPKQWKSMLSLHHLIAVETLEHEHPIFVQAN